jgi:dTMP kinase
VGARFIALEGPDGAGKSVQAARLAESLRSSGRVVTLTREPGGTELGEAIRRLVLEAGDLPRTPVVDALLFSAARAQSVDEIIRPALERGEIVVCDRFADSTLAYQGYGGGIPVETLRQLERVATGGLRPHLVILLDLPVAVGLDRRAHGAPEAVNRFESSSAHDAEFHESVRRGYLELAAAEPQRWRVIDAARDVEAVAADVALAVGDVVGSDGSPDAGEPHGELVRIHP